MTKGRSIDRPQARSRELKQMPVRVAEVNALAAALPGGAALDRDVIGGESLLPLRQLVLGDRKGDMQWPRPIMRRDGAARHVHRFERTAAREQEEHAAPADRKGGEPAVLVERLQFEHVAVEARGAVEIIDIERG